MKKQILIVLSVITGLLTACSTANFAYYDDIYTSTGEKAVQKAAPSAAQTSAATAADGTTLVADSIIYETDENGNLLRTLTYYPGSSEPVITNYTEVADSTAGAAAGSYGYNPDDYYDYSYSSRLRRFHTGVSLGFGYYDPYFTNMYWYDYAPASWGLSIYLGYNWWWPGYYYRPYYYSPYWYDYGFRYGWGWYGPHYACCGPWYHPHHHHGPEPIDYYHNHHDPNHAYYYGHRNNIGPSVGNGDRGNRPDRGGDNTNRPLAGGHGNGETNNHYSVTSSPVAFNQRYDNIVAGTTGTGSAGGSGNSGNNPTSNGGRTVTSARSEAIKKPDNQRPAQVNPQPVHTGTSTSPTNASSVSRPASSTVTAPRTDAQSSTPSANTTTTTTVTRPAATSTTTRPAASASSQSTGTVTRTVVRPSNVNTRPTNNSGNRPTSTTRPSSSTSYPSGNYNSRPSSSSTARPSSSPTSNSGYYNRPSSSSTPTTPASRWRAASSPK